MIECKAYKELLRVKDLVAFNIQGYESRLRKNQFMIKYTFDDNSILEINKYRSLGRAFHDGSMRSENLKINA